MSISRSRAMTNGGSSNNMVGEMVINEETFDPSNPSLRPEGWRELRNKRVVVKEQIDR